jgi:hypothetical protein
MVAKAKTERVKCREPTISLAVDYARPHWEVLDRGGDLRKARGEIIAIARVDSRWPE